MFSDLYDACFYGLAANRGLGSAVVEIAIPKNESAERQCLSISLGNGAEFGGNFQRQPPFKSGSTIFGTVVGGTPARCFRLFAVSQRSIFRPWHLLRLSCSVLFGPRI